MDFVTISVKCNPELTDLLIAEFFEIGFDSFQELDNGFEGSIQAEKFNLELLETVTARYPNVTSELKEEAKVNWNKEWEKNYDPIIIEDRCLVRASFHPINTRFEYEIVVNPKMSFGTGHHATTYQLLAYQMDLDHSGKSVLDVGCGTGILSIMAKKRGATKIIATDIDDWCIENSRENFSLNEATEIKLIKDQIQKIDEGTFDIIIANINKNVLMDQIKEYAKRLNPDGHLLLSGFYSNDSEELVQEAEKCGLIKNGETEKDQWAMLVLQNKA